MMIDRPLNIITRTLLRKKYNQREMMNEHVKTEAV